MPPYKKDVTHLRFSLEAILHATNNFAEENIIGHGSYGKVYKGQLFLQGQVVDLVARRLDSNSGQGSKEFWNEIELLSRLEHRNLVYNVGFCDDNGEMIIVNKHEARGSLDRYLGDPNSLSWTQRLRICVGVTHALSYIYYDRRRNFSVIHRNIKSSKILLNDDWEPKLSGFGLAMVLNASERHRYFLTDFSVSYGYKRVSHKSDMYSFGVVLFQVLCGRNAFIMDKDNKDLVQLVKFHYEKGKLEDMIDSDLWEQMDPQSFDIFSETAYQCLNENPLQRPDIDQIVTKLEKALELQTKSETAKVSGFATQVEDLKITHPAIGRNIMSSCNELDGLKIPLEDILSATNNFADENIIRQGGFGKIYKGQLLHSRKLVNIVARRLDSDQYGQGSKEFWQEILMLSILEHENLVSNIGFCVENDEKIVIYNHVERGSLERYISDPNLLWTQRLKICVGVAHALSYLHYDEGRDFSIVHRDIKSSKVLLDDNWEPKLSGFGLAINKASQRHHSFHVDPDYIDPAYVESNRVSHKSDMYSFGIVLLEVLCRRKAFIDDKYNLPQSFKFHYEKGKLEDMIDSDLWEQTDPRSFDIFSETAYQCLNENPLQRPDIDQIVTKLEKALELQTKSETAEILAVAAKVEDMKILHPMNESDLINRNVMPSREDFAHLRIPFEEIENATNMFADENLIGEGGFGRIYKGILLRAGKPTNIAARRLHYDYGQGDLEFWNEISMLTSFKHENLVSFIGYCSEKGEKIIVNEYQHNQSLDKHLKDPTLTWMQRLQICVGVARALNYIHYDVGRESSAIHRNIKSSKILLDDEWKPKLAGFEHSKTNTRGRRHRLVLAEVVGTIGYVDPTYEKTGFVTHKSDVFSFGVVLFEVMCGRRAFIPHEQDIRSPQHYKEDVITDSQNISTLYPPLENTTPLSRSKSFVNVRPSSFMVWPVSTSYGLPSFLAYEQTLSESPTASTANRRHIQPSSPDHILSRESSSFQEHGCLQQPLFTMKRLEQYSHSPNEELLAQLAKSHYDEENLDDIIDPALREQMDPESFKIFSATAFNCLKEQRAQRPNIDHILRNLEKALEHQIRLENPDHSIFAREVGRTSSNHFKGGSLERLKIPLTDILLATENFTKGYLGSGAYGKVYGAELDLPIEEKNKGDFSKKRRTVAIKCLTKDKFAKDGFIAEVELLTRCKHDNVVSLLGFCDEGHELILVYEHALNGSLNDYLGITDKSINLTWTQRLKISTDIARGLNYLHTSVEDEQIIIHRDIKSDNILLGKNWVAKIADFGLSRLQQVNQKTHYSKNIAGTEMYMCPEYQKEGKLKRAVDIYSLGVVLFEILSGKPAYDNSYTDENEYGIAHVARRRFKEGTLNEMVDPKIMEEVDELTSTLNKGPNQDSLKTFMAIAYHCVRETQKERPTAEHVLKELEKASLCQENNKNNLQLSFEEIKLATQNFSCENLIGGGGFGRAYKGEVARVNECHTIVAKRLDRSQGQGEHHFLTELEILFDYKHENIIRLEGYCNEKKEKVIIYEHASNISLDRHLGDSSLTWMKRLNICIGIARGLAFLHGGAPTKEMVIHRDIKSANILLNGDWKAKISDFGLSAITAINQEVVSNLVGTHGYLDPVYERTGFFTEKSDIYSLGVVLFEILYGKLLVPDTQDYKQGRVNRILKLIHDEKIHDYIVFSGIKEHIAPESLSTFRVIVSQCLDDEREKRPTAEDVLRQLNKALELQEDVEVWEPKLPNDYKEILQMSGSPGIYSTDIKKDLYNMFSKGILLKKGTVSFSIGRNGERNVMISAKKFSYIDRCPHKWRSVSESRFPKVVEILDISNLAIKIKTRTQLLSKDSVYGVYLVFKFCESRKFSSKPMYVNLKYKKGRESLHAYFATWRDDEWMTVELFRFLNHKKDMGFKFILESFSPYYCGDSSIYVEGIEFRAIDNVKYEEINKLQEVQVLTPHLTVDEDNEKGEKLFWLGKVNGKKHLIFSAKSALHDFSNVKEFTSKLAFQSRFQKVIELLPQQVFRINFKIKSQMLSPDTEYMFYLVFKLSEKCRGLHCPVKVRDLLHRKNKEAEILYFRSPSQWNLHGINQIPEQREDGWMEVKVWKFNSNHKTKYGYIPVNLKLICYEGTMSGLIVCAYEFRSI